MSKQANQKLKLLYLKDYLERETDERHPTTVKRIIDYLASLGISCERKTVYADIEELQKYGVDIIVNKGKNGGYFVGERDFEPIELRLLMDAVSSSRFLTPAKTDELKDKLCRLTSVHEREWLDSPVDDSMKSLNSQIYFTMDTVHKAVVKGNLITFKYWKYSPQKTKVYKKDGGLYTVAAYLLTFSDGNYYLIGKDMDENKLKTFRADKMEQVKEIGTSPDERPPEPVIDGFIKSQFSIYDGEMENVTLVFDESLMSVMVDKFGKDVPVITRGDSTAELTVSIKASIWFYSWLVGLGKEVRIGSPQKVREEYLRYLQDIISSYNTSSV